MRQLYLLAKYGGRKRYAMKTERGGKKGRRKMYNIVREKETENVVCLTMILILFILYDFNKYYDCKYIYKILFM